ncbi:MAG TPA: hypothetical protein VFA63_16195 [Pseudonocardiaceae bacterium]|nr:hypothetical protein [Pseudonocardiaceae bacterium]
MVGFESARAVADAVLYEGYLLYPYRRSSGKNRVRWQFGVLAPRRWLAQTGVIGTSVAGSADAWHQQTECLLQAPDLATIQVRLRFCSSSTGRYRPGTVTALFWSVMCSTSTTDGT